MKKVALGLLAALAFSANAEVISAFEFDGNAQDKFGNGSITIGEGSFVDGQYEFSAGQGITLNWENEWDKQNYALEIGFTALSQLFWSSLISFDYASDTGIYTSNGLIKYYSGTGTGHNLSVENNYQHQLVLKVEDGVGNLFLNGKLALSNIVNNYASPKGGYINIFKDNSSENLSGKVDYIRVHDDAEGVMLNYSPSFDASYASSVPLTTSISLMCLGLLGLRRKVSGK